MPIAAAPDLRSGQVVTLAKDTPCYHDAALQIRATVETGPVPLVGTSGQAYAVVVVTRAGWSGDVAQPTILYIPKLGHKPVAVPGGPEPSQAAADMWDRWALGLGIPTRPEVKP